MIPPEDIQRVRKLTDEEEQLLRDHVGLGTGGDVLHVGSIFPRSAGTISFFYYIYNNNRPISPYYVPDAVSY
jgi:hypothetical protein